MSGPTVARRAYRANRALGALGAWGAQRARQALLALGLPLALAGAPVPAVAQPQASAVQGGNAAAPADTAPVSAPNSASRKVLRLPLRSAETSLDHARIVDVYSRAVTGHIYEALVTYDPLARPVKIVPLTAEALPEPSADFKTWTVRVKPGIHFAPDAAFKGQKRELVAADYAYSWRRMVDPANKSPVAQSVSDIGIVGLAEARTEALKTKQPFDYDRPIEGLQVLDRYTLRIQLKRPSPRFLQDIAASDLMGASAREVVDFYGDKVGDHPVGTGPYRVVQWRRSSFIALERNPHYRPRSYEAQPAPDDAEGQAILAQMKGKRIPMIDRIELSVIEESQPRWLSFLNGQVDALAHIAHEMPNDFVNIAMPGGQIAPNLAKRGIVGIRNLNPDIGLTYFNMEDPVVGGYTPDKVALRRAIALATDVEREIRLLRRGQAMVAQSQITPHTDGYDPTLKTEMSEYNPPKAKALLDVYGYVDKNGDGWRDLPNGRPLVLEMASQPEQINRQFDELWKKNLNAIGIQVVFKAGKWAENLKTARAGKLQMWMLGSSADRPDSQSALSRLYGPQSGGQNLARFKNARFDEIYDRLLVLPNGPEREALYREAKLIGVAYMPYKVHVHRFSNDLLHPWVQGYRRPLFWQDWWHLVDIDLARKPAQ